MMKTDILIIGAGITGTAVARELSRFRAHITVIERGADIAEGATKANSGIVHAGYDALPGTKKALFNVRGAAVYGNLCASLGVPYRRCGALVVGFDESDRAALERLKERGRTNGVPGLEILEKEALSALEPSLNPEASCALNVPGSAIVSPYELAFAMADDAALNGVEFRFGEDARSVAPDESGAGWIVDTGSSRYQCRAVINCAGAFGAELHNMISPEKLTMVHRRGQYYLLDRAETLPFSRTIFQCPNAMGKGVLISPTVHGNLLIGPNAEDIENPLDTATTPEGLSFVLRTAQRTWPFLSVRTNITNFSGIRAHLNTDDFAVGAVSGCENAYEAIGIESPGLSSAPAIGEYLAAMVAEDMGLKRKDEIATYVPGPKPFHEMTGEERDAAVRSNPEYGNIICRCEVVTEAEIRTAIRRPVGARTIDGVKRRTRAGMGRCQGGFCMPRVAEILSEELDCGILSVTKDGGASRILCDTVENMLKEAGRDE